LPNLAAAMAVACAWLLAKTRQQTSRLYQKVVAGIRGFRDLYVHLLTTALISKEAEEMHKKGSERLQRILGLDTFSSMNNLANVLQEQGRNSIGRQAAGPWTRP
jgi:hypothetical protein